jgi:hypothetical protein
MACRNAADICGRGAPYFPTAAHLATFVMPDAGHSINLHYHATRWFAAATTWIDHTLTNHHHGQQQRPGQVHTCAT